MRSTSFDQDQAQAPIRIRGATQNNLKHLDLDITPGTMTVITGPSGSGKSSLAFDTLYAEGQRRYVETFSPYARQFLDRCDRPKVESIDGVPPAIAIEQNNAVRTSRSTVGTMTELNDYIKLLFARQADLFCGQCGRPVRVLSAAEMFDDMKRWASDLGDCRLSVAFFVKVPAHLDATLIQDGLSAQGFTHVVATYPSDDGLELAVASDRFKASRVSASRGVEAFEKALSLTQNHRIRVYASDADGTTHERNYVCGLTCPDCMRTYSAPTPSRFSFNSAVGACPQCHGFGRIMGFDMTLVVPDETLSLEQGCVKPWQGQGVSRECQTDMMRLAKRHGIRTNVPFKDLSEKERRWVIDGEPGWYGDWKKGWYGIAHYFTFLESKAYKMHVRVLLSRYRSYSECPSCKGARLQSEGLFWRVGSLATAQQVLHSDKGHYKRFVPMGMGAQAVAALDQTPGLTVHDLMQLPVTRLQVFFTHLRQEARDEACALVIDEILARIGYLIDVGLGYLTLDRQSRTLSGGEVQRVNLTTALGTHLVDTLFVLDEPSVGLHPRDMDRVNAIMGKLKNAGNTLVVVEHDPQVMLAADRIIDMGPGAGEQGGSIVYDGPARAIGQSSSLTGLYLSSRLRTDSAISRVPQSAMHHWLTVQGAHEHNLKHITVRFPLQAFSTVTGVSGSGKSTLVGDVLVPALRRALGQPAERVCCEAISGERWLREVVFVDQSPIGKSSRSNPVVYVGAFDAIRQLFAQTPTAQQRLYKPSTFSFNSGTGRCPTCQGAGFERIEMQFLSDVFLRCADCNGTRYRSETLEVTIDLHGQGAKNIADVLDMTVDDALAYFVGFRDITRKLQPLADVGLGYVRLGQSVSTLSGGEAQRLKLAEILSRAKNTQHGGTLYVFDEPTTGLHFCDIEKLLRALRRLIAAGNTVLAVEHNLDVIGASDWVVDLGPDGGEAGGQVLAQCPPNELMRSSDSFTGKALADYQGFLAAKNLPESGLFAPPQAPTPRASERSLQSVWRQARRGDMGIFGAREHNLNNIDVVIPRRKLSVITGVSGSGKSTLAFGIVFSEGQRRYLESLNAYARSMTQPPPRADVEQVIGIAPTVAIEQRTSRGGRKSTVATMTEIQHFLRLLFVKLGVQYCPDCHIPVTSRSKEGILATIMREHRNQTVTIAAPLVIARKGIYTALAQWAHKTMGVESLRVDGQWVSTSPFVNLARYKEHTIEMPTATLNVDPDHESELEQALDQALFHGHGIVTVLCGSAALGAATSEVPAQAITYSTKRTCPRCAQSFPEPDPRLFSFNSKIGWCPSCLGTGRQQPENSFGDKEPDWRQSSADSEQLCPQCHGARLNRVARNVLFEGHSIDRITALSVDACLHTLESIELSGRSRAIGEDAIKEIVSRLRFLQKVGLGYLCLDRDAPSLSGGEAQRIRLAAQLGSTLQGVCYVLDEPTIGLHARDNALLIDTLEALKNKGNTVIVVEHDEEMIRRADHIIDIGPGAGSQGGNLVAMGPIEDIEANPKSVTGAMLKAPVVHSGKARHAPQPEHQLHLQHITCHNLHDLSVSFPLGCMIALTGVSGSGKSTLARDVLLAHLSQALSRNVAFDTEHLLGVRQIARVLEVDQSPIGKTPRSCPATYVGFFNHIRDLYASTPEAQARGYGATRFSFNTVQGRCPVCQGQGEVTVEMNFLPDVKIACEACNGMRFDEETLAVKWHGLSIGEVLNLSVDDALAVFADTPRIAHALELLQAVGLGYLRLGQPSSTLSGGEAQRIKLVTELAKARPGKDSVRALKRKPQTFYILDEPTVGLHMADVQKLIDVLHRLVEAGNTVLVIEHNLDVIAESDWVIDLGPEGGPEGGRVVATGEPIDVARCDSPTGRALAQFLHMHADALAGKENP